MNSEILIEAGIGAWTVVKVGDTYPLQIEAGTYAWTIVEASVAYQL